MKSPAVHVSPIAFPMAFMAGLIGDHHALGVVHQAQTYLLQSAFLHGLEMAEWSDHLVSWEPYSNIIIYVCVYIMILYNIIHVTNT